MHLQPVAAERKTWGASAATGLLSSTALSFALHFNAATDYSRASVGCVGPPLALGSSHVSLCFVLLSPATTSESKPNYHFQRSDVDTAL